MVGIEYDLMCDLMRAARDCASTRNSPENVNRLCKALAAIEQVSGLTFVKELDPLELEQYVHLQVPRPKLKLIGTIMDDWIQDAVIFRSNKPKDIELKDTALNFRRYLEKRWSETSPELRKE